MVMKRSICLAVLLAGGVWTARAERELWQDFKAAPHNYWTRPLRDRFSLVKEDLVSGKLALDRRSEKGFVQSLLKALGVPASSQMLVFSATSLQLSLISTRNPRALYFSDDLYVGWMPGGKVEMVSLDPELGGIYYIFEIPRSEGAPLQVERSNRCMNCHGAADSGWVPGLVISSVVPGPNSGSLVSYRQETLGHGVPLGERLGGWMVTGAGAGAGKMHRGNVTGELYAGTLTTTELRFGESFDLERYPAATSDLAAHLLHEHQAGFVTIALEAGYRMRAARHEGGGAVPLGREGELAAAAEKLGRYLLFTDEAALPPGGARGDGVFLEDFAASRRADGAGRSLRDLDLKTRLLQYRCSYMIYSAVFSGLDAEMKRRVLRRVDAALQAGAEDALSPHLPKAERAAIREILAATLPEWSAAVGAGR